MQGEEPWSGPARLRRDFAVAGPSGAGLPVWDESPRLGAPAQGLLRSAAPMGKRSDPANSPPSAAPAPEEALSFEASLSRLEALVERLEQGDLALEAALGAFEEGVQLARRCSALLGDAERRIDVLMRDGGGFLTRPLEAPEEAEGE